MKKAIFTVALLVSGPVLADAPFCVASSYGQNCFYYSVDACVSAANAAGGMCINNPNSRDRVNGSAPFCVRSQVSTDCYYYDANTCRNAAQGRDGVCVYNPRQ